MTVLLIVDDDGDIRDSLADVLEQEGIFALIARDGGEALGLLRSGKVVPDGILLDLMMPGLDGFEFLEERAKDPELLKLPVILISALPPSSVRFREETSNTVVYLQKPFDLYELLVILRRVRKTDPPPPPPPVH